jgi:hypothetical protein
VLRGCKSNLRVLLTSSGTRAVGSRVGAGVDVAGRERSDWRGYRRGRSCQCAVCGSGLEHPDLEYHRQMNVLLRRLDEQQRHRYLAVESQRLGHGADRLLFEITGVDEKTIRRGRDELAASLANQPTDRVRQPGGGHPPVEKGAAILSTLEALVAPETAGEPTSTQKWVRYSLHVNSKQLEARSNHPDRDVQFTHINEQIDVFKSPPPRRA